MASTIQFYDWTSAFVSSSAGYTFNNTSAAGTISGSSLGASFGGGIASDPGTWGVPTAITPLQSSPQFTNEFQDSGQIVPSTATFNFSSGYNWGSGGELLIGNIHGLLSVHALRVDRINETGTPINVNTWGIGTEYPSTAVGTAGYFSTSNTQEQPADANGAFDAVGVSENFYVIDNTAMANFGQGGVLTVRRQQHSCRANSADDGCWVNRTDAHQQQFGGECAAV